MGPSRDFDREKRLLIAYNQTNRLLYLLDRAKKVTMSEEDCRRQRISFTYGNLKLHNPNITREMVEYVCNELDRQGDL